MNNRRVLSLVVCVSLCVVALAALLVLMGDPARAAGPWYVAPGGDDGNDCLSPATPCGSINGAIGKASSGDTIFVATGTYTGAGDEVVLLDKNATLSGGWDAGFAAQSGTSTIDGEGARRGMTVNDGMTAMVERFTVQNGFSGNGGGIRNDGTLTLNNSTISYNTSSDWGGGGIYNSRAMTLNNSMVSVNSASWRGGGIWNSSDSSLTLNNSIVSGNTAGQYGGGIYNSKTPSGYNTLTLNNSTVSDNTSVHGGGIYNSLGTVSLWNSIVRGNAAMNQGGGIYTHGPVALSSSTVSGNMASRGGGIFCKTVSTLTLENTTVSGNTADDGGGIYSEDLCTVTQQNSTISGNTASGGGGIYAEANCTVTLQNTILADNTADSAPDCSGAIGSSGYNLVGDTSSCTFTPGTGDVTDVSAGLGLLIGSPGHHPLLTGSPAIDAVPLGQCILATDQRGVTRPQGAACDMGAYEKTVPGPAASIVVAGGTPQRTLPFSAYGTPVQAAVLDAIGTPVSDTLVTFSAPSSGASGTFADSGTGTTTAVSDEGGVATAATFLANGLTGRYTVTATVSGLVTPANFVLTNVAWYVSVTGNNGDDCFSPATPCATINGALNKPDFVSNDAILVATGIYTGTGTQVVLLDKDVTLSGGWDETFTSQSGTSTIDGEGSRQGIVVEWQAATVENFTVLGGSAGDGGGVYNFGGSLTLNNSTVRGNTAQYSGGGIYNYNGTMTLNSSSVSHNTSQGSFGGGVFNTGTLTLNSSTVSGNTASHGGGGIFSQGTLFLNNNTVCGNTASDGGGVLNSGTLTLSNSILAGNMAGTGPDCSGDLGSSGYNLIGDTSGCAFASTTGDLTDTDPKLSQLIGTPGYHPLLLGSPAIDAGNPAGCSDHLGNPLDTDQRGAARVGRCDIGAYEYTTPGPATSVSAFEGTPQRTAPFRAFETPLQALVLDSIGTPVNAVTVTFFAPASDASGTFADTGTATTTALTDDSGVATTATFTANGLRGSYTVTATVGGVVTPANFLLNNIARYVAPGGSDSSDCLSPTTACASINGALNKPDFVLNDTILVATGTYTGTGELVVLLDKSATLSGGWDATFTAQSGASTIDAGGDPGIGISVNSGVTAIVERFAVQNGGPGISIGGALILSNSTVSGNTRGGIFNGGSLTVNNSTVSGNTLSWTYGGGIWNGGTLTLNNSTVSGNSADERGGGIYNGYGFTSTLNSSTVSGNSVNGSGGGIYNHQGTVTLQNTIVAGNTASGEGPDCAIYADLPIGSAGYNLIGDTSGCTFTPTTGDLIDVDPRLFILVDSPGYHPLRPGSPAIDAGNPAGCTDHLGNPLTTDQRGTPRPLDGDGDGSAICDMGAYELDPANNPITSTYLPCITRNYCPDFFDDFSNPASGWEVVNDSFVRSEYLNGEYRILTKRSGYFYLFKAPTCDRLKYTVEADARWVGTPGASYGLVFGITSGFQQYYLFDINTDYRKFDLVRRDAGGFTQIVGPTYSAAINGGTASNHLKVTRNGDQITLEVNGTVLGTWSDGTIGGRTGAGLVTNPYSGNPTSDARFDNFSMASLPGSGASAEEPGGVMAEESERAAPNAWRVPVPADMDW